MQIWQAIVLGAVQGFTEFLPVSSSGHLILLSRWLGVKQYSLFFGVMLHLGTLVPVGIVFFNQIKSLFKKPFNKLWLLVLATIPAGVVGLLIKKIIDLDQVFTEHLWLLGVAFVFTAIELLITQRLSTKALNNQPLGVKSSLTMGIGQALAVFPGLSRSGTTIFFGQMAGLNRENTANFTFLMSIPIILSAVLLEGAECVSVGGVGDGVIVATLFGVLTSAVTGYIAVKAMLKVIKNANYKWFSLYLIILGALTIIGGAW